MAGCQFSPIKPRTNQIFQILDKLSDVGVLNVQWSGGEPLLRADFLDLVNYAPKVKQNGYLLIDDIL